LRWARQGLGYRFPVIFDTAMTKLDVTHANSGQVAGDVSRNAPAGQISQETPASAPHSSKHRQRTVRFRLTCLVLACVLPVCLVVGFLVYDSYQQKRRAMEHSILETARVLSLMVDRELANTQGSMAALATSPSLASGDLAAFHRQALLVLRNYPRSNIILADSSGQQLVNASMPFGTPLPKRNNPEAVRRIFATGRPEVTNLFKGAISGRFLISTDVPVFRGERVAYDLALTVPAEYFQRILSQERIAADWTASIYDKNRILVARSHFPERYIGLEGSPVLLERLGENPEGTVEVRDKEATDTLVVFSRSATSGWTVGVGIPKAAFLAGLRRSLQWAICWIVVVSLAGIGLAALLARRMAESIQALIAPALALGSGAAVELDRLDLAETNEVGQAMVRASQRLQQQNREQNRAEAALRQSEERLRLLGDNLPNNVVYQFTHAPGDTPRFLYLSAAVERLNLIKAEDALKDAGVFFSQIPAAELPAYLEAERISARNLSVFEREVQMRLPDGQLRWMHLISRPRRLPDGQVIWDGVETDITDRKQAEEALQESERFLHSVIDLVPHLIFVKDEESRYLLVNRACAEAYGKSPEQMIGRRTSEIVSDPKQAEAFMKVDREVFAKGTVMLTAEEEIRDPSGGTRLHQTIKTPFVSSRTGKPALIGVAVDITEHKQAQQALAESEARLRAIVELAPDGILVSSQEGQILLVNEAACRQHGYTRHQLLQLTIFHIVAPRFIDRVKARRRGETPSGFYESVHLRADGTEVPVEISITEIVFHGEPAFLQITRDITKRKQAEQEKAQLQNQLLQAQKLESVGQLAGGVAHDFNNLLQVINGYSDLLLRKLKTDDLMRELVAEIRHAGEQGSALTKQLLTFSREQIIDPKPIDLNAVIRESQAMLQRLAGEDVQLETSLSLALGLVMSDEGRLHQLLMNLAANSRDAMPRGGKFTIRTANVDITDAQTAQSLGLSPGPFVLLQVSDAGKGIPKEIQERIFEPFFTTKELGKGTGLGLATVYGIVRSSGGAISVRSEMGEGTTFDILLPRVEKRPAHVAGATTTAEGPRGVETILVVEDRPEVRRLAVSALQDSGYRILEAAGGSEALRIAGDFSGPIHLLLTDVIMPRMSGKELAEHLRQSRSETKVLYMSGYAADVISGRGLLDSGERYIAKPFSVDSLLQKVREVLEMLSSSHSAQASSASESQ
jgi:PAS domain S-box-containing protein